MQKASDWIKNISHESDWIFYSRLEIDNPKALLDENKFTPIALQASSKLEESFDKEGAEFIRETDRIFPHKIPTSGFALSAKSCLVSRRKTEKEREKILKETLFQPLNSAVSICRELHVEACTIEGLVKKHVALDDLDWDLVKSLMFDFLVRSECRLTLPQFPGILIKIHKAIPSDRSKSWDCLVNGKTQFIPITQHVPSLPPKDETLVESMQALSLDNKVEFQDSASLQLYDILSCMINFRKSISALGVQIPKGILIYGPPGVGKSHLVATVTRKYQAKLFIINPSDLSSTSKATSLKMLREKFAHAKAESQKRPVVVFMDELDSIAPPRQIEPQASQMVAQLLTLMDGVESRGDVVLVGATNRPNYIDAALRRPGRFDREIQVQPPNKEKRLEILQQLTSALPLASTVDLALLARNTNGYVMADLVALVREASILAATAYQADCMDQNVFLRAFEKIGSPALLRESAMQISSLEKMDWSMIGGCDSIKAKLQQAIEWPLTNPTSFERLGLSPPRGILLYGPPGCSKTTMVKIIASKTGLGFFSLSGASIYSSYLGESEQTIRTLFQTARSASPSIIFLDELDAIVGKRGLDGSSGTSDTVQERVLSTLLNEMDGIENAKGVLVIAASNRPDLIDAALLRPGRFDQVIYVPAPSLQGREEILKIYTRDMPICPLVDMRNLAERTKGYTGADLKGLCREAALLCIRRNALHEGEQDDGMVVKMEHFELALSESLPTISREMELQYEKLAQNN